MLLFLALGQFNSKHENHPTKSQLLKLFKSSIRQDKSGKVSTVSNPWVICNKDSSYYMKDTLQLINTSNNNSHSSCCNFINWTFYKKTAFVLTREQLCKEPPTVSTTKNEDWYTIEVYTKAKDLFLEIYKSGKS